MARLDDVFAELQAKISATIAVIVADPELAARVREAMDAAEAAEAAEVIEEENRQDDARANALSSVISQVGAVLREVVPLSTDNPPEEPPA